MSKLTDSLMECVLNFESGRIWYNKLVSPVTKRIYLSNPKNYCDAVGKNPDELIQLKLDGLKSIGTNKEFQAETLSETYLSTVKLTMNMKDMFKTSVLSF